MRATTGADRDQTPSGSKTGRVMNPYEANFPNVMARVGAWLRGAARHYRRPLLVVAAASVTLVVSVSAGPAEPPAAIVAATGAG